HDLVALPFPESDLGFDLVAHICGPPYYSLDDVVIDHVKAQRYFVRALAANGRANTSLGIHSFFPPHLWMSIHPPGSPLAGESERAAAGLWQSRRCDCSALASVNGSSAIVRQRLCYTSWLFAQGMVCGGRCRVGGA
ncbi:MAG: hypothetical protein MUO58_05345, partial [Anaerolineales bacterium]|nr:hypothetical protein [Anaerolineales bacterium]